MICDTIVIRPYELGDANDVYMAINESRNDLGTWMPWCYDGYSVQDAIKWISEQKICREHDLAYEFAIIGPQGRYLGGCGVNQIRKEYSTANLGYWVRSTEVGQGIATRAVQLLCKRVFASSELARLELVIATTNIASLRVAEKAGATLEGLQRARLPLQGKSHDALMYSIIRKDLLNGGADD